MFDKLIELIINWITEIIPFVIIYSYEEAVLLRLGKFKKTLGAGIHFKIPFFDNVINQHVVVTTLSLPPQSLYTLDKQNFVVKGLIKYKISDVKVLLLEVYDAQDALSDMTLSIIKSIITTLPSEDLLNNDIDNILTKKTRVEAKKWGVEIHQVTLTDIAPIKSFRLISDSVLKNID